MTDNGITFVFFSNRGLIMHRLIIFVLLLIISQTSFASSCRYWVTNMGSGSDASWFEDIVTEDYCRRYPSNKFKIVVTSNSGTMNNMSFAWAQAFVSVRYPEEAQIKVLTPRYSSTMTNTSDRTIGNANRMLYDATREAVRQLMSTIR